MNVIWIVADTFRRDHLGAYGNPPIRTPALDALATRSMRFDRHYIGAFPTMPTRADHQTGRWTMSFMSWAPLGRDVRTLAHILTAAGYHTAASVDTPFYLRNEMNYDRGFQTFFRQEGQITSRPPKPPLEARHESSDLRAWWRKESDRCAPQTMIKAGDWLERHYEEDFFLLVDTWDPHEPWDAPDYYTRLYMPDFDGNTIFPFYGRWQDVPGVTERDMRQAHAAYCGEVTMVDTWIGYLLRKVENMGLLDRTAIIFTTDHGYYFGEHGGILGKKVLGKRPDGTLYTHGEPGSYWDHSPLYEEVAAIPLLVSVPGLAPGAYRGVTSAVDLMPTVLDLLGQPIPDWVEGRSLMPALRDCSTPGRAFTVSTEPFANPGEQVRSVDDRPRPISKGQATTVTTDRWSLIYTTEPGLSELYDLTADPNQTSNLICDNVALARELHQTLLRFMQDTHTAPHLIASRRELRV